MGFLYTVYSWVFYFSNLTNLPLIDRLRPPMLKMISNMFGFKSFILQFVFYLYHQVCLQEILSHHMYAKNLIIIYSYFFVLGLLLCCHTISFYICYKTPKHIYTFALNSQLSFREILNNKKKLCLPTWLLFPVPFIYLCSSKFPSGIIFPMPQRFSLTFLY